MLNHPYYLGKSKMPSKSNSGVIYYHPLKIASRDDFNLGINIRTCLRRDRKNVTSLRQLRQVILAFGCVSCQALYHENGQIWTLKLLNMSLVFDVLLKFNLQVYLLT